MSGHIILVTHDGRYKPSHTSSSTMTGSLGHAPGYKFVSAQSLHPALGTEV